MAPMEFLETLTYWHWFILGAVFISIEMLAPGVVFLWLGVAAIATGLAHVMFQAGLAQVFLTDMGWQVQGLLFAVLSVISVTTGRIWAKGRPIETDQPNLNLRGAEYVGRIFTLQSPIENGYGKIIADDTQWKITGADAPVGTRVKVIGMDAHVFTVEKAED